MRIAAVFFVSYSRVILSETKDLSANSRYKQVLHYVQNDIFLPKNALSFSTDKLQFLSRE